MVDITIAVLGILPKNIDNYLQSENFLLKRFRKISTLRDFTLTHDIDICIFQSSKITTQIILEFKEASPNTVNIVLVKNSKPRCSEGIFYWDRVDQNDSNLVSLFFHNLVTSIKNFRNREEFTAMLLHDTRSPINSIIGYLELLENGVFGKLNEGQSKIISNVMMLSDMLVELVEDLNIFYQLEQNKLKIKKTAFSLKNILDDVMVALWIQADQKNIKIHQQIDQSLPKIIGDSGKIQRVLMNIITNAIKFSPNKRKILIKAVPTEKFMVKLSVSDNGPGINKKDINNIFEKYYKKSGTSNKSGLGLGLYISKSIVEAHGGKIQVNNNKKEGCTFSILLPAAK